jgi:hypothetical protein
MKVVNYIVLLSNQFCAYNTRRQDNQHRPTGRVPLVEQELLTFPEHLSSHPVFSGACVTRSLVLYVCFVEQH